MSTEMEKVLERINKIQRLAENGGTPEEAAAAAAKVQQLLAQHGLSMAEVDLAAGLPTLSGYGHQLYAVDAPWKASLMNSVAKGNGCAMVMSSAHVVDVIGHRDSVQGAIVMHEWLCAEIERLAGLAYQSEGFGRPMRTWKTHFRSGAAYTIGQRLKGEAAERATEHRGNAALIAIDSKVRDVTHKLYPKTTTRARRIRAGVGFEAGVRAGRDVAMGAARIGA